MTEDDRTNLYWSLLRGLANEAQDRLCQADERHSWSPWHHTLLRHDKPLRPVTGIGDVKEEVFHTRSDRYCLNCGKQQVE